MTTEKLTNVLFLQKLSTVITNSHPYLPFCDVMYFVAQSNLYENLSALRNDKIQLTLNF